MEFSPEGGKQVVKETVFQLISHNQHLETLTREISDEYKHGSNKFSSISELCCMSMLKNQSLLLGTGSGGYNSEQCASFLSSIVKNNKGPLLTESAKDEVNSVVQVLKTLVVEGSLDKNQFLVALMQHSYLPLELAWILAKEGLIHIENYVFKKCSSARLLPIFKSQLKHLSFEAGISSAAVQCLAGVLTELIEIVFTERKGKSIQGDFISSLSSVLDGLVLDLVDLLVEKQDEERNFTNAFTKLDNSVVTLKKASSHFLSLILSHKPITKVSSAIQLQANWCYGKVSPALLDWYKQILLPFSTEEILEILQRVLEHQEVNWQLLLSFVSTTVVCLTDAQKPLLDFVDKLFQEGLENSDMESLITGMLLIRQACFHGPHVFMSYSDWFQRTFYESSRSLANTRKSFSFFLKFLTDIVPYEDAPHLKVHILRPPFVPPKCREQLADYILLAKTRLADLKESIEAQVQEEQKSVDESKQQEELQAEVENTVHAFELSGKIPSSLMEASIFKKPYYIGRFLPALLKPRMLPSVADARMRLVEALKKAEKIPPSMYTNYEKACKKETLKLTEGLFVDLDSDDDLELSPMELLVNSLSQFHQGVQYLCGIIQEAPKLNVREVVSLICEKIESVLGIGPSHQVTREGSIILDTDSLGQPQNHLEVIDALLNSITKSVHSVYISTNPDFTWLSVLLKGLTQYSPVVKDMFRRIWVLIFTQEEKLENHHIDSLAAVLVEIQKLWDSLPLVQLSGKSQLSLATRSFTEHVYQMIPVSSGKAMSFTLRVKSQMSITSLQEHCGHTTTAIWVSSLIPVLRLTASYMKYLVTSEEGLQVLSVLTVPPQVIKKLMYTVTRLIPEVRLEGRSSEAEIKENQFVVSLYRSVIFQDLLHKIQFTFSDWLSYEISVDTDQDVFSYLERYEYYSWTVYQYFLPLCMEQGGFAGDFKLAASQILQVLLANDLICRDREPSCSGCKNKVLERSTSRNHMISLLQELTRMFQLRDTYEDDGLPWLPSQLVSLCEDISFDIQRQARVISFFRIALCLPSYLLFCDHPQSLHLVETRKIAEFFRKFLVEYLVTDGLYLPLSLTLYIVQGLRLSCLIRDAAEVLDSLCETSPVIALSILVHHKHLDYFLEYTSTRKPVVREIIYHFRDNRQSELMSHDWMIGAMLFSMSLDCRYEALSSSLQVLSSGKLDKAIAVLTQLLVLYWTSLQVSLHHQVVCDNLPVLIGKLLQGTAGKAVVAALLDGGTDSMSSQCVKKSILKIRPVAVMRLLTTAPLKSLVKIYSSYCGSILNCFIEVGHMFEQICPGETCSEKIQQAVTLEELMLFNKFLKDVIAVTPKNILRDISQDVFLRCGTDVVLHVQRCLS